MKKILFLQALVFSSIFCKAQSFIGFSSGFDYAQIQEVEDESPSAGDLWIPDKDYSKKSIVFGVFGEQYLSKKVSMSVIFTYTRKEFEAYYGDIIYANKMSFRSYRSGVSIKWHPCKYAYFGSGMSLAYISDATIYYKNGEAVPYRHVERNKKYGIPFLLGLGYKQFMIEPYYLLGFSVGGKSKIGDIQSINSMGITFNYLLRVSKKKK